MIAFIGDSLVHYNDNLAIAAMERYSDHAFDPIKSFSFNGWTTKEFAVDQNKATTNAIAYALQDGKPVVHSHLGINDLKYLRKPEEVTYWYKQIYGRCAEKGVELIAHLPSFVKPNTPGWPPDSHLRLLDYHVAISRVGCKIGDMSAYWFFSENANLLIDGVHPTKKGSIYLGNAWMQSMLNPQRYYK